ncbi:Nucleic acid-binding OB-fold [Arabidopsis thaliana x Arabidopsis arenosa]|uniref:Nucleic acid-binding OB-fold n=1 Tax=Arabidopsis thaliana x Arabidopsis arenosa TaxID=1240361 RepID=A0A8T2BWS2_9BRAS|nr:Nucleic acid-binding OB-fold [Arabidopsis thaliana x Arabidopsis arenosa]
MSMTADTKATTAPKRKPVFVKVNQLKPGTSGHTLIVKVLESNPVKPAIRRSSLTQSIRSPRIAECLIGDDTGCILFTARNDQVDLMKTGATVILRNAKIDLFKDTMRMVVDRWGRIEVTDPVSFEVNRGNNLSLIEYELVTIPA